MKQAFILGCSHALGSDMWESPRSNLHFESTGADKDQYGLDNCYPAVIARALGYEPNNLAIPGGSNDAMFRIFESLGCQKSDVVIACWTGGNRTEIFDDNKNKWVPLSVGHQADDVYTMYLKQWINWVNTSEQSRINKIKNIYAFNTVARLKQVKVININSFWPVLDAKWNEDIYWPVKDDFYDWSKSRNFAHGKWGHFYEDAHHAFAQHVLQSIDIKFVDKNYC